ncbi:hypothetical protein SUBVAR_05849 [Subdoligranulum variabile DSM 15176]|uniref:Uncharacterized protein n=1 Tax=Subdoligranulum variabile DSM 15176 TaxID=411471 RepID=D1PNC8_9FIRM|nr:hypothetical protein SUBVAR_05849 [Subdoligranulum variabile DSM 15176]
MSAVFASTHTFTEMSMESSLFTLFSFLSKLEEISLSRFGGQVVGILFG